MVRQLPIIGLFAISACGGSAGQAGKEPASSAPSETGSSDMSTETQMDTDTDTTSYATVTDALPDQPDVFELEVDGVVTELYSQVVGLSTSTGDGCEPIWTLSNAGLEAADYLFLVVVDDEPIELGSSGVLGAESSDGIGGVFWYHTSEGVKGISTPSWDITQLGPDALQLTMESGQLCPFIVEFGDSTEDCEPFITATLTLVDSPRGFDPTMRCWTDPTPDEGFCTYRTMRSETSPPFCP